MNEILSKEAESVRAAIEENLSSIQFYMPENFPVMSCKLASILLAEHLNRIFSSPKIIGVGGAAIDRSGEETITHFWLQYDSFVLDITLDQYNILSDNELNDEVVASRPLPKVYTGDVEESHFHSSTFSKKYEEVFHDYPDCLNEYFHERLTRAYKALKLSN